MQLEPVQELEQASLGEALQAGLVEVLQAELHVAALEPFEIVVGGPAEGTRDIDAVDDLCGEDVVQKALVVVCATQISEDGCEAILVPFEGLCETEFGNDNVRDAGE